MPRPRKPIRLWLEPERQHPDGRIRSPAVWTILDAGKKHSTGCGKDDHGGAQEALELYLATKHGTDEREPDMPASKISIANVLAYYAQDAGADVARPVELAARIDRLLDFWGDKPLSHVKGFTCKEYVKKRGSDAGARRDLEDLRAAINLYKADGLCRDDVVVTLPDKPKARLSYLTRDQIAALIWHCWKAREVQKGVVTDKYHLRHAIPYIMAAVYTGSRSARIWQASFKNEKGLPWLDLEGGVFYRTPIGETAASNKRANSVRIPERLLAHMVRWARKRQYLVQYRGRPADPKKAVNNAMTAVFGADHGFVRHTFRHTCATWLMWSGVDVGDIASYMSMTREMVVEVYGKEHPDADQAAGRAFSDGSAGRRRVGLGRRDPARRTKPKETTGTKGDLRVSEDA